MYRPDYDFDNRSVPTMFYTGGKGMNGEDLRGKKIILNSDERHNLDYSLGSLRGKIRNSLGAEQAITTLTYISKDISVQSFYEIYPADYYPMKVGEGAFDTNTLVFRSFETGGTFEQGYVNTGVQSSRNAMVDVAVDALSIKHMNWEYGLKWNVWDLKFAAKSGNWDIVTEKEIARKRMWDLGLQRIAFLGAQGQNGVGGNCLGLFNQPGITTNTSLIKKPISSMDVDELQTLAQGLIQSYQANCNYTKMPSRFIVPQSDWNGMAAFNSPQFPILTIKGLLEKMFQDITLNPNFKILPNAYAGTTLSGFGYQQYTLLNYDPYSLFMSIPLMYTSTLANSLDNMNFQSVAYGQHTGCLVLKPLELMYYTFPATVG